jgi:Transglycosylase SLT domain
MFVIAFLNKYLIHFTLIGFIVLCTGCVSNKQAFSSTSGADLSLISEPTSQPSKASKATEPDIAAPAVSKESAKSAQASFKKIYAKYSNRLKASAQPEMLASASIAPSYEINNELIKLYRKNHLGTPSVRHHTVLFGNDCQDRLENVALTGKNWQPVTAKHVKSRLGKSSTKLQSFFHNRLVLNERERFKARHGLLRGTTKVSQLGKGLNTASPCVPTAMPVIAQSNTANIPRALKKAQFDSMIIQAAQRHQVDERLVRAVIQTESAYNSNATSSAGAVGLMQLMPGTAKQYGVTDRNDPNQNINGGTRYLKYLLGLFNYNLNLAVAAYNAGENAVKKHNNSIPPYPETQNYVRQVLALYNSRI